MEGCVCRNGRSLFVPCHEGTFEQKRALTFEYQNRILNGEDIEGNVYPEILFAVRVLDKYHKFSQLRENYKVKQVFSSELSLFPRPFSLL